MADVKRSPCVLGDVDAVGFRRGAPRVPSLMLLIGSEYGVLVLIFRRLALRRHSSA